MVRLILALAEGADWHKLFDPRGGTLFVPAAQPPEVGAEVRVDLTITEGGPRVILKGTVFWRRTTGRDPAGCAVGLGPEEREKINFINGFVRGGLINRRERRRLPLRLPVTYTAGDGPHDAASRDVNDEGIFVITETPLAEGTDLSLVIRFPGVDPVRVRGTVTHTVIVEDEDVPGMGIRYRFEGKGQEEMMALVDRLEAEFHKGTLPEEVIS